MKLSHKLSPVATKKLVSIAFSDPSFLASVFGTKIGTDPTQSFMSDHYSLSTCFHVLIWRDAAWFDATKAFHFLEGSDVIAG